MKKLIAVVAAAGLSAGALVVPALAATSTKTVKVADDTFVPKTLTVKKGTTVKFRWTGRAPHNVTVTKGPVTFRSSTKTKGTYSKKLTRKGTYAILCTIHAPDMKMVLKVK